MCSLLLLRLPSVHQRLLYRVAFFHAGLYSWAQHLYLAKICPRNGANYTRYRMTGLIQLGYRIYIIICMYVLIITITSSASHPYFLQSALTLLYLDLHQQLLQREVYYYSDQCTLSTCVAEEKSPALLSRGWKPAPKYSALVHVWFKYKSCKRSRGGVPCQTKNTPIHYSQAIFARYSS